MLAVGERVHRSQAGVVGGVGGLHHDEGVGGAQLDLVVGRLRDALPFEGGDHYAGAAVGGADQVGGGDGLGEVDLAAPQPGRVAAVFRAHPPV